MKKSFFAIAKLTSLATILMMAAACSPTNNSDSFHYPQSSLNSSGSWSGSNARATTGNGYFYEYDGI